MDSPIRRCFGDGDPLMEAYHDSEWGVPVHGDTRLFEALTLQTFQAGLSWRTILHKREGFRRAFEGFAPARLQRPGSTTVKRVPSPGRLQASIRPPCASTIPLAMASPSPAPEPFVRDFSTR